MLPDLPNTLKFISPLFPILGEITFLKIMDKNIRNLSSMESHLSKDKIQEKMNKYTACVTEVKCKGAF